MHNLEVHNNRHHVMQCQKIFSSMVNETELFRNSIFLFMFPFFILYNDLSFLQPPCWVTARSKKTTLVCSWIQEFHLKTLQININKKWTIIKKSFFNKISSIDRRGLFILKDDRLKGRNTCIAIVYNANFPSSLCRKKHTWFRNIR